MASTWTQAEDELLRSLVNEHGAKKWAVISAQLGSKGSKQCRRRWKNYLNVELKKGGWTAEEDAILLSGHKKFGNKWTEIAKLVGGRTDNAVKNRFAALCKRTGGAVESSRPARKSRAAAAHSSDSEEEDADDSNEDELDVTCDFKQDQAHEHKSGNRSGGHGGGHENGGRVSPGKLDAGLFGVDCAIPSSAVASATAALQSALAAFQSQTSQNLGTSTSSAADKQAASLGGLNPVLPPSPTPTMFMSIFLSSPQAAQAAATSAALGLGSPRGGGFLGLGSGVLDTLAPPLLSSPRATSQSMTLDPQGSAQTQLPISQLKLELPNLSQLGSEAFPASPSSYALASALEGSTPQVNQLKRSAPASGAMEEGKSTKRRPPIPSPWQQAFAGVAATSLGLSALRQLGGEAGGHGQGQYSQDGMLIQTAMSNTPRTPCTPKLMASAQEAAARQVATAKALADAAASCSTTFPRSSSPVPLAALLSHATQKRGYKKPSGLSISIPEASAPAAANNPLPTGGFTLRVYKDLLTPCELQYAKEMNDMDLPLHIELEDAPLSTSRNATMQALSALISPGSGAANDSATPLTTTEGFADLLSWLQTPRAPLATTKGGSKKEPAARAPLAGGPAKDGSNAVPRPAGLDLGGAPQPPPAPPAEASQAVAAEQSSGGAGGEHSASAADGAREEAETTVAETPLHSGHKQLLMKLIGGAGSNEEDGKAPGSGAGVIVPSPRRAAVALSPTNYSFGLDSAGIGSALLSPMWSNLEGLMSARGLGATSTPMTPRMNDEIRQLLDNISTPGAGQPSM